MTVDAPGGEPVATRVDGGPLAELAAAVVVLPWPPPAGRLREDATAAAFSHALDVFGVRLPAYVVRRSGHGRPALHDRRTGSPLPVTVNLSHSGGHAAVAVAAAGSVGVDIQVEPTGEWRRVARRWLHPDDLGPGAPPRPGTPRAAFTRAWAVREARCKAISVGLAAFRTNDGVGRGPAGVLGGVPWRQLTGPAECALAVACAAVEPTAWLRRPVVVEQTTW